MVGRPPPGPTAVMPPPPTSPNRPSAISTAIVSPAITSLPSLASGAVRNRLTTQRSPKRKQYSKERRRKDGRPGSVGHCRLAAVHRGAQGHPVRADTNRLGIHRTSIGQVGQALQREHRRPDPDPQQRGG